MAMGQLRPVATTWNRYQELATRLPQSDCGNAIFLSDLDQRSLPGFPVQLIAIILQWHVDLLKCLTVKFSRQGNLA
jgi:hypothetical protein